MNSKIKLAFASGTEDLNRSLIQQMRALYPELPLWVVSDFPPEDPSVNWIRYRVNRPFSENLRHCREALRGRQVRLAGVMLVPNVPFRRMRMLALVISPRGFLAFNENLNNFMLRPGSLPAIARHLAWRTANALRWSLRTARKADWRLLAQYGAAKLAGWLRPRVIREQAASETAGMANAVGITVVIPSRTGRSVPGPASGHRRPVARADYRG